MYVCISGRRIRLGKHRIITQYIHAYIHTYIYQDDASDWENVVDKRKKKGTKNKGSAPEVSVPRGPATGLTTASPFPPPATVGYGVAAKAGLKPERKPFFGLWVGNVHADLVDEDRFREAFEQYG